MPNDPNRLKWGPYLSNRQWGTVREDYSANGDAWNATTHDQARSKAWRWGEEGIGGISDDQQHLCFAPIRNLRSWIPTSSMRNATLIFSRVR